MQDSTRKVVVFRATLYMVLAGLIIPPLGRGNLAHAAGKPEGTINFAYATWVGTGYYKVGDQTAYVLRGNFSYTLRKENSEDWGLDILFPATIGFFDFDDVDDSLAAFTLVPGVQFAYPVLKNWWLKPFGHFGIGRDFSSDGDIAYIWAGGIRSLATFPMKGFELDLGNSLMFADQSQSGGNDNGFSMAEIGLNGRWPLNLTIQNRQTSLNIFFVYANFPNDLNFERFQKDDKDINQLFRVGVALGAKPSFSILGIPFRGVGIDATFGEGYRGLGLTTGFPF